MKYQWVNSFQISTNHFIYGTTSVYLKVKKQTSYELDCSLEITTNSTVSCGHGVHAAYVGILANYT